MLKVMRQSFQQLKWVLWFVVFVFIAFIFVDWGMGRVRGEKAGSGEIATVNGGRITAVDFNRQFQQTQERYRQMYRDNWSPALAKALDLPNQVLNGMIDRRMLVDVAHSSGVRVSDAELAEKIQAVPSFQKDGQFIGAKEYRNLLAANGFTADQFERDFRDDMMIEKFNRLVAASLVVPDSQVADQFARQNEKAKIDYVLISPDHFGAAAAPK
jgi:peptidyl-prolyl cis-trans isomerase D